jgi:AcrR family transcriptional regulator
MNEKGDPVAMPQPTPAYRERRADILRAAGEVFYEWGYHAASMQKIADRAGILKPALYYYVRSKEDLLFELAAGEQSVAFIEQFIELDRTLGHLDGATRLKALITRWTDFVKSGQPKASLAVDREYRHIRPERLEAVTKLQRRLPTLIEAILRQGTEDGSFVPGINLPMVAESIWALLRHLYICYDPSGKITIKELREWHVSFVLQGLGVSVSTDIVVPSAEDTRKDGGDSRCA